MKNALIYICLCAFAFYLGHRYSWDSATVGLFLYSSWAFIRIGQLHRMIEVLHKRTDHELESVWEAFTKHIKENR